MNVERMISKMLAPAQRRIQNMVLRGTVALSVATGKMQVLQLRGLADETLDGIEHFEPYGWTSRPLAGAEALTVFVDGDRSHGITAVCADRRYRMQGLDEGDVAVHDDQGQSVRFRRDGVVEVTAVAVLRLAAPAIEMMSDTFTHNGVNVGGTHVHGGVDPGPAQTSTPS